MDRPLTWTDLRGRERGRPAYIIGDGPTADRILPCSGHVRVCMNLSPALHAPDYWIRSEPISYFAKTDLLAKCRQEAARWQTARVCCLELDEPEPGEIVCNWTRPEDSEGPIVFTPFAQLDQARCPRHMGTLGAALALAVWLDVSEIELVGVDFGQVAGRYHWYDPPEPQPPDPRAGGVYEKFYRTFRHRAVPALAARCIPIVYSRPPFDPG